MKASDNPFPSVLVNETTAPSAPAASKRRLYVDANHVLRWIDSSSLDSPLAALNKWGATTAPTTGDDSGDGYAVGSRWIDTTADKEYVCLDSTGGAAVWKETSSTGGGSGYLGFVVLQDQKTANTAGGTFTSGAWQTRVINTEVTDTNNDCTLSSNQITLVAGTYECAITAPAIVVDRHKARLQNVTDATTVLLGTTEYSNGGTVASMSPSCINGRFTIAGSKALEVQHQCQTTRATNGFGVESNFGVTEIYTEARFWRVS